MNIFGENMPIEGLKLTPRIYNALVRAGISTAKELKEFYLKYGDLSDCLCGIGKKSDPEINAVMQGLLTESAHRQNKIQIRMDTAFTDLNTYIAAERRNRFIAAKIKKQETEKACVLSKTKPIQEDWYPVIIKFTWGVKNKKKDPDNVAFAKKFILDGLTLSGILAGDSMRYIDSFSDEFKVTENPHVLITIISRHLPLDNEK